MYPALRYPNFDTVGFLEKEEEKKKEKLIYNYNFSNINTHLVIYLCIKRCDLHTETKCSLEISTTDSTSHSPNSLALILH